MTSANVRPPFVLPHIAALLCAALVLSCSSDDALPTSASPAPLDARPAAALTIGPATPLSVPSDCPGAMPVDVSERGVIVGWADAPCFGATNAQAFRLYPDGTWDSLPEPYGRLVSPISIGRHNEVYVLVQNPDPGSLWLVATIDAANRLTWLPLPADGLDYGVVGRPNDHGTFVLRSVVPNGEVEHFLWNGRGKFQPLPMPPAGQRFRANGLNDHEVVVGTISTDERHYAATWSRRDGYRKLALPAVALYGSTGDLIDDRGRVYGQTSIPVTDNTCAYWSPGMYAQAPTVWNGRDTVRVLTSDAFRCRTTVMWEEATDAGLAVGTLVGDAPDLWLSPSAGLVLSAEGRLALAPCPEGGSCRTGGIDRADLLVGGVINLDRSPGAPLTWSVDATH